MDLDDHRVKEHIKLIPVLVDIDNFMQILQKVQLLQATPVRAKIIRSFLFLTAGMEDAELDPKGNSVTFKEAVLQGNVI